MGASTFFDTFAKDNTPEDMAQHLAETFSPELQTRELLDPGLLHLVAEVDHASAGFARLHWGHRPAFLQEATQAIEIQRFYARQSFLGAGVGAALMAFILDLAKARGFDCVWLGVWEHNHRAQAFYRKWGFVECGEHPFVLGKDVQRDVLMARPLT